MQFNNYITLDQNWLRKIVIGVIVGIIFIVLNLTIGITIGIPDYPQATEGERLGIVSGLAPLGEELAFRGVLLPVLELITPQPLPWILNAGTFAIYHAKAYGGGLSKEQLLNAQGAFIGAFIFGLVAIALTKFTGSILPAITTHLIFNTFLVVQKFVIIG